MKKQLAQADQSIAQYKSQIEQLKKDQQESLVATEDLKKQVDSILGSEKPLVTSMQQDDKKDIKAASVKMTQR